MAAFSRPARHAAQHNPNSNKVISPTVDDHKSTSPTFHNTKRAHGTFSTNDDYKAVKKQKFDLSDPLRSKVTARGLFSKSFANNAPADVVTRPVVALSRVTSAVQPPATGTIIANGTLQLTNGHVPLLGRGINVTNGPTSTEKDKRTLRSQDGGSRSKSELALYFPNYEELISNEPRKSELLTSETRVFISENPPKSPKSPTTTFVHASPSTSLMVNSSSQTSTLPNPTTFQTLDFSSQFPDTLPETDPLCPTLYDKSHRRAERQEKHFRNIEKERAQHEKVQLERLLDGLRGPDWLRVMGISGVTDSERKTWQGKRSYCISEVRNLIEKFRNWKEEERRQKQERETEASLPSAAADSDTDSEANQSADVDALAARQLHFETLSATTATRTLPAPHLLPPPPPPIEKPFTTFFKKQYMRDAAMGKHRRGRTRFAFGAAVPDIQPRSFRLPGAMLTLEARRASARNRRRARRQVGESGGSVG